LETYVPTYVFVLVMLVIADGQWRDWKTYTRLSECEEVLETLTRHRENVIIGRCEAREVSK